MTLQITSNDRNALSSLIADIAAQPSILDVYAEEARQIAKLSRIHMDDVQRAMKQVGEALSIQPALASLASLTFPVGIAKQKPATPKRRPLERYAWRATGAVAVKALPGAGRQ